jgi:hypothetical protein
VAAGIQVTLPGTLGATVAGLYRYRSGYPFTPGFRNGVDVNGDGSGLNDPAFVDAALAGVSNLFGQWNCLRVQTGRFVERNSCREPGVHAVDVRLGIRLGRSENFSAELFAEGLNLTDPAAGERDRALYRIDPSGTLVEDTTRGTVTLPLIANPDFGTLLRRAGTGRTLRLGLQVSF